MENQCEFYPPTKDDGIICAAGIDVPMPFACTEKYAEECLWAIEARRDIKEYTDKGEVP